MSHSTAPELLVLHAGDPTPSDLNLVKLAAFMGIPARCQPLAGGLELPASELCVAMSAATARRFGCKAFPPGQIFLYGFEPTAADSEFLSGLTGGALCGVQACPDGAAQYGVSAEERAFCGELAGLTFGPVNGENDLVFDKSGDAFRGSELAQISGRPFVVGLQIGGAFTVLSGSRTVLDLDAALPRDERLLKYFSQFVPALWFLRRAFGERCWHSKTKGACVIVDDPLLRPRHGFLQYERLLQEMNPREFTMSIAFIPWNFRRSDRKTAELFGRHSRRLTLSVHGCDHTKAEFGGEDEKALLIRAGVGRDRMARHHELTGVPCDNVMVFPQGVFSPAAMEALQSAGYLAAVNSTPFTEEGTPSPLKMRDLMAPAVLAYSGFPLFVRHYPDCLAAYALDLLMGKPALVVEHHEYFKSGYEKLKTLVDGINQLDSGIAWSGLEEIIRQAAWCRRSEDESVWVKFFTNHLVMQNDDSVARRFYLCRDWDQIEPLPWITFNGKKVVAQRSETGLYVETELQAGERLEVKIVAPDLPSKAGLEYGTADYRLKVFARRRLCELRDNYVAPFKARIKRKH